MNEHDRIHLILPLAASGDVSPDELRQLREHLDGCEACRRANEEFAAIAGELRGIPTPQPSADLVARVQEMGRTRLGRRRAVLHDTAVLAPLVVASWIAALATWPLLKEAAPWMFAGWQMPSGPLGTALAVYSASGLLLASISAAAVGVYARTVRRTR